MNIKRTNFASWVSPRLGLLVPKTRKLSLITNSFTTKASFDTFSKNKKFKDNVKLEKSLQDIDFHFLHELTRHITGENKSFRGFISSQLSHGPVDFATKSSIKRAMAIKKMCALINATKEDMRAIELQRICYSKG